MKDCRSSTSIMERVLLSPKRENKVRKNSGQQSVLNSDCINEFINPGWCDSNGSIKLGQTFKSFDEVSQVIAEYASRNEVSLKSKYSRRIAANPKPSNKEDYKLTKEERKRFVYRWVDFCCTYYDDLVPRGESSEAEGSGSNNQALGFTMKECPMRIRFQLRTDEKDLMISILKEVHEHDPPMENLPTFPSSSQETDNSPRIESVMSLLDATKRSLPPSLAAANSEKLSKMSRVSCSIVKSVPSTSILSNTPKTRAYPIPSLQIPKPPPLKAMPSLSRIPTASESTTNGDVPHRSAYQIIRNVMNNLKRMQSDGANGTSGALCFTSSETDIVQLTAELTGVSVQTVQSLCPVAKQSKSLTFGDLPWDGRGQLPTTATQRTSQFSSSSGRPESLQASKSGNSDEDEVDKSGPELRESLNLVDMPLEVLIKTEPEEAIEFYNENDSDSDASTGDSYSVKVKIENDKAT